jgi:hypothetical protein
MTSALPTGRLAPGWKPQRLALLCCLAWLAWPALAQPPGRILFNSNFEIPALTPTDPRVRGCSPATACWYLVPESAVPGWNVVDEGTTSTDVVDDNVEFWNSGFLGVPAQSGNQFIELNADKQTPVFFEICMFAGETLTWSLWHRGRSGVDQMFLNVTDASGNPLASQTFSTGNTAWVNYTGTVTNTGPNGSVRFTFRPGTTASGSPTVGNFIDNIQVLGLRPLVEFASPTYSDIEHTVNHPRLLVNGTIPSGGATVTIGVTGGSAAGGGVDYSFATTVTIPSGNYDGSLATSIPIGLNIVDDFLVETNESINFSILSASNPLLVNDANCGGTIQSTTTYTIIDDDVSVLPVVLVSFAAQPAAEGTVLTWQTSQEQASDYFEVRRSLDGQTGWQVLGRVAAAGNTNYRQSYSLVDNARAALAYYQLKIVDLDHSVKYSKIVAVSSTEAAASPVLTAFPNPVARSGQVWLQLPSQCKVGQLRVLDLFGREQAARFNQPSVGALLLDAPPLPGTYLVQVFDGVKWLQGRLVVY